MPNPAAASVEAASAAVETTAAVESATGVEPTAVKASGCAAESTTERTEAA